MQILRNTDLVMLNRETNTLCKISLLTGKNDRSQISAALCPSRTMQCFGTTGCGLIVTCMQSDLYNRVVSFYSINLDGTKTQLAIKCMNRNTEVWDLKIRPAHEIHTMSFDIIDEIFTPGQRKKTVTTRTTLQMKWDIIRILFIACFKPVSTNKKICAKNTFITAS